MSALFKRNAAYRQDGEKAVAARLVRVAMILSFTLAGVAGAYFGTLYLITH